MQEIYLDYNASAPLDPRVVEEMLPVLTSGVGNASSAHRFGQRQAGAVELARDRVAALVGGTRAGVVFTAGATEANNLALRGAVEAAVPERKRLLISAVEHASVRRTARRLADGGLAKVDVIGVTPGGFVDLDALDELLGPDVLMVSVMAANSETGVLNPVAEVAERVHAAGALLHCDATQQVGRLPFDMASVGADLVSLSDHKICGLRAVRPSSIRQQYWRSSDIVTPVRPLDPWPRPHRCSPLRRLALTSARRPSWRSLPSAYATCAATNRSLHRSPRIDRTQTINGLGQSWINVPGHRLERSRNGQRRYENSLSRA